MFLLYPLVSCFDIPKFNLVGEILQLYSLKYKVVKFYNIHYLVRIFEFSLNF